MRAATVIDPVSSSANERAALSDLVHRYAAGVDDREFGAVTKLFTASAELIIPAVAAVTQTTRTEHAIVGEVYDVDPPRGRARGRIACIAHHWSRRAEELMDVVWHLRYDDEYDLTDSGWRISRRALTINAIETRPVRRLLPRHPD